MEELNLSENLLKNIQNDSFKSLSELKDLIVAGNKMTFVNASLFLELTNLQNINFSYNQIEKIEEDSFKNLPKLKKLNLNENRLSNFEFLNDLNQDEVQIE